MSKISNTRWQMAYQRQEIVYLEKGFPDHGDPKAYDYMKIPAMDNKSLWEDAPVNDEGDIHFYKDSRLTRGGQVQLDFTYFRTFVELPAALPESFKVTIGKVDDGARIYLFNKLHPEGIHVSEGARLNGQVESNELRDYASEGQNLIVVVQFDDCPVLNTLTGGISIKINDEEIKVDPNLEIPNGIHTFYWSTVPTKTDEKTAIGKVGDINYTYQSTKDLDIEEDHSVFGFNKFPKEYGIPDKEAINHKTSSANRIVFDQPVFDPVLVFASIGQTQKQTSIVFDTDIQLEYKDNVSINSGDSNRIDGNEGYAIVKLKGKFTEIKYSYIVHELSTNYLDFCHFIIGAAV